MNDIIVTKPKNRYDWMSLRWNHALTSVLAKKGTPIPVKHITTDEYLYDVEIEHSCDMRDYPEVCGKCTEQWHENTMAAQADNWDTDR